MARPRRKPEKTDVFVGIRMTAQEKADATAKAAASGVSLAELIRVAVSDYNQRTE